MDGGRDFSTAVAVSSVQDEYGQVRAAACPCGGRYAVSGQSLLQDAAGRHFDALQGQCQDCRRTREFLFDISSFFASEDVLPPPVIPPPAPPPAMAPLPPSRTAVPAPVHAPETAGGRWTSQPVADVPPLMASPTGVPSLPSPPIASVAAPAAPPVPASAPAPRAAPDRSNLRGTLDLVAVLGCLLAIAAVATGWYASAVTCILVGLICWFIPCGGEPLISTEEKQP